ncbi:MAG: PKD domain-containing protein [Chitinophagales bacterium]
MKSIRLFPLFLFYTIVLFSLPIQAQQLPQRLELGDSTFVELISYSISDRLPLYYSTFNVNAAKTIATNQLWQGGNLNLQLTGDNLNVGVWDGGAVRASHQELANRVVQMDGATNLSNHATHVAGTIAATGVNPNAKGMANQVQIDAYYWNNDQAEMTLAATNGLLVSNHSYGFLTGWFYNGNWYWFGDPNISQTEDYRFGFYSTQAKDWDEIAYNAPNYLIVKAAGNDRTDTGPSSGQSHFYWNGSAWVSSTAYRERDGGNDGFDCISHAGISKNVLTVGAVGDIPTGYNQANQVNMSVFSAWGMTDDGRIKPDIVANGVGLTSCLASGDNHYGTYSGTSMASPNVSGSLILLQEHHQNLYSSPMKAATLKGLVIHTADEAGTTEGPDYRFGWGLMNSQKAAELISQHSSPNANITETTLNNSSNYTSTVYSDGTSPLTLTLSWTDLPGTVPSPSLNPTDLMLVNDLDIRLTHISTGETFYPYTLDPNNPLAAATTEDNFRDNMEKIFLAAPAEGIYSLNITHKNSLVNGSQDFSLITSGTSLSSCMLTSNFDYNINGLTADFSDTSIGAESHHWDFGDGNNSSLPNPNHTYASNGTYTVCLTAIKSCGNDVKCQEVSTMVNCGNGLMEEWQATFGGSNNENLNTLAQTFDGGYILVGNSNSLANGNKSSGNFGGQSDAWVVKLAANGNKEWDYNFGGTGKDDFVAVIPTNDNGFIIAGNSNSSISGNKNSTHYGSTDYWLVKLNSQGTKQWEYTYGGSQLDQLSSITPAIGGGYILAGHSKSSISGSKTSVNIGVEDYWVVKVDSDGLQLWDKTYGGTHQDWLTTIEPTSDGYLLGGWSFFGDYHAGHDDYWVVKIDLNGVEQWNYTYGGEESDRLFAIAEALDGGYVLGGYSFSGNSGNKTSGNYGNADYWVVKVNSNGIQEWDANFGGSHQDYLLDIEASSEGGFLLSGSSSSNSSGNKTSNSYGGEDAWLVKINETGSKEWEISYGGISRDYAPSIVSTFDGGFAIGGVSESVASSGNKMSTHYGEHDFWVVKTSLEEFFALFSVPHPICVDNNVTFYNNSSISTTTFTNTTYEWKIDGVLIATTEDFNYNFSSSGTYSVSLTINDGDCSDTYQHDVEVYVLPNAVFSHTLTGLYAEFSPDFPLEEATYYWDFGEGNTSTEESPNHTFNNNGTYNVCLTMSNTCDSNTQCQNIQINSGCNNEGLAEVWQQSFGGGHDDFLQIMHPISGGGYLMGGSSESNASGNKSSGNYGGLSDAWLVKTDGDGNKIWDKNYGGNQADGILGIIGHSSGDYFLAGNSSSGVSGNKSSANYGNTDFWLLKINAQGDKIWDYSYGGSGREVLHSITNTPDGGFLLMGYSNSSVDGSKTSFNYGGYDFWVVKVDENGTQEWDKTYGGSGDETLTAATIGIGLGDYLLGGYSDSPISGNKTVGTEGGNDFWIVGIDANGNLQSDYHYGGTGEDKLTFLSPATGGFLLGGYSNSGIGGSKQSSGFGDDDYWVVKTDFNGLQQWDYTYGGTQKDLLFEISSLGNDEYLLSGYSESGATGNKTASSLGSDDFWTVKINGLGYPEWETVYGGTSIDNLMDVLPTSDNGFLIGGYSESPASTGTKTAAKQGNFDYWVMKVFVEMEGNSDAHELELGADKTVCSENETVVLAANLPNMSSYMWYKGSLYLGNTADISVSGTGVYSLTVIDACGETSSDEIEVVLEEDCVWCGDFNGDGTVDHTDVLSLGVAYNSAGALRPNASFDWTGQACSDWSNVQNNGINQKHIDGDGNGTIDLSDQAAVEANYGNFHSVNGNSTGTTANGDVMVRPVLSNESAAFGQNGSTSVDLELHLESPNDTPVTLYGLAFQIHYSDVHILEVQPKLDNSWMGTPNSDMTFLVKHHPDIQRIDMAIVGVNLQNRIDIGNFAILTLIVDDVLPTDDTFNMMVEVVGNVLIDNQGVPTPMGSMTEEFVVENQAICPDGIVVEYSNTTDLPLLTWVGGEIIVGNLDNNGGVQLSTGDETELIAGGKVVLQAGTDIQNGAIFTARIEACQEGTNDPDNNAGGNKRDLNDLKSTAQKDLEVLVYPNPITDYTHIAYELLEDTETSLYIIDKTGKVVQSLIQNKKQKPGKYKVGFEACAARIPVGIYYVVLETLTHQKTTKLVKVQ